MAQVPSDIADRLYAAPPENFVAERDRLADEAREAGDRERATAIGKLRKPTVAAWLVNLLALRRPDLVAGLVQLAGKLRAAQRELRGGELRELSAQRRAVVDSLVAEARELAVAERPELVGAKLPLAEVEATLSAALADEETAGQVRSGRLLRAVAYAGFGEVPRPKLKLVEDAASPTEGARPDASQPAVRRDDRADQAERAERALARARTDQEEAEAELARATAAEQDGARVLAELEAELAELQRRRTAAEEELGRRKLARKAAERALSAARRRVGEAQAVVEDGRGAESAG